jgi:hypothetical protein
MIVAATKSLTYMMTKCAVYVPNTLSAHARKAPAIAALKLLSVWQSQSFR